MSIPGVKTLPSSIPEKRALVLFWAEWCGHCQSYKPEYQSLSKKVGGKGIYAVHCPDNNTKCAEHGIQGYPTLKCYENGTFTPCPIPRSDLNALEAWLSGSNSHQSGGGSRRRKSTPRSKTRKSKNTIQCTRKTATGQQCLRQSLPGRKRCWQH